MRDPASLEVQLLVEEAIGDIVDATSLSVLTVFSERLSDLGSVADAYAAMAYDLKQIEHILEKGNKALLAKIRECFDGMANGNDAWAEKFYKASGVEQSTYKASKQLRDILEAGVDDAMQDAGDLVKSSGMVVDGEWMPIQESYKQVIGNAAVSMNAGATAQQAIGNAIGTITASGGLAIKYPRAVRSLYAAVRMNVMGTYRQTMVDMRMQQGMEFGADGVEVSAHVPCAPDHEEYQGKRFSLDRFEAIQSYELSRQLIYGANCRHTAYPVITGIGKDSYSAKELEEMRRLSNEMLTFDGISGKQLTMSRYEASQYQRRIERSLRKSKEKSYLMGIDELDTSKLDASIRRTTAYYKEMSAAVGLAPRLERTKAYML